MLAGWDYVELRGNLLGVNGPERGFVEFCPTDAFEPPDGSYRIVPSPFRMMLDANGFFSVQLIATDSPTMRSNSWVWKVVVRTETIRTTRYFRLPLSEPVVDYVVAEEETVE